jgi:hypothetical protein
MSRIVRPAALTLVLLPALLAAQGASKPTVPPAEWTKWETPAAGDLSPDGKWVAYEVRRVSGNNELRYRPAAGGAEQVVPRATAPQFTRDSRWLAYVIAPDTAGAGGRGGRGGGGGGRGGAAPASAAAEPARNRIGIVDLNAGTTLSFEDVQSFALSRNGAHVALRRYRPAAAAGATPSRGTDLVVRDLGRGTQVTFGNVADFAWNDEGALLAMTMDVEGRTGNGVQVLDASTGALRSLDAGDHDYTGILWRAKSADLAVFRSRADTMFVDTSYAVIAWKNTGTAQPTRVQYDFSSDGAFPAGMRVASYRALQWSADGSTLIFGIAPREPRAPCEHRPRWKSCRARAGVALEGPPPVPPAGSECGAGPDSHCPRLLAHGAEYGGAAVG